jgi:DNA mismatch repair ATPase MutS
MRSIQERWEKAGSVPRDARERLESGLRRVEDALRKAEDTQWRRSNPEALARAQGTVAQIKAAIDQLEKRLAQARASGDAKAEEQAADALAARRAWLEEAERTLAEFSG